jgi:hypothetical protein
MNALRNWQRAAAIREFVRVHGPVAHRLGRLLSGHAEASRFDAPAMEQIRDMARRVTLGRESHDRYAMQRDRTAATEAGDYITAISAIGLGWDGNAYDHSTNKRVARSLWSALERDRVGYIAENQIFLDAVSERCAKLLAGSLAAPQRSSDCATGDADDASLVTIDSRNLAADRPKLLLRQEPGPSLFVRALVPLVISFLATIATKLATPGMSGAAMLGHGLAVACVPVLAALPVQTWRGLFWTLMLAVFIAVVGFYGQRA